MSDEERKAFNQSWVDNPLRRRLDLRRLARPSTAGGASACSSRSCSTRSSPRPARRCAPTSSATPWSVRRSSSGAPRSRRRSSSPGSFAARSTWCQGFSEPDSGSDLASLKTSAVLDGDEWVINGQKVWTTQAQHADYVFLLARTDPGAAKHAGISYLLVPMHQPGVEVRPITQVDGSSEFNEVFFTNVRCPEGQRRRRGQQRVEGRHDDARLRARVLGHDGTPPVPQGVGSRRARGRATAARRATGACATPSCARGRTGRSWRSTATAP